MAEPRTASSTLRLCVLLLVAGAGAGACDQVPARATLSGWPPGEPTNTGSCEFLLKKATVYHSSEWHLDVEIVARNTGLESVYCSFEAQTMTSSDTALTDAAKGSGDLGPDEEIVREASAREANVTGLSTGSSEDAWVYVKLAEGHWPMDTSTGVIVTPERIRPPD